ncbi:MAG TPA: methylmalonyl-CoA mutase family protein [Acidimicrobiia bacterium]|nr:methylmalonyl-CoA mutase family protein [Acidimicrobiia bacterium]
MRTPSGIEIAEVYDTPADPARIGRPGEFPFTRGPYPTMYRGRLWTMRQYAGFGTAEATNQRFRRLLDAGQTGLSVAFDLPTQMGLDSDHPLARGEVGRVGVAIDTLDDMRRLLAGIPLDRVSTSMTINATAPILLLLYQLVAEEQGVDQTRIRGTVQNDILKEYIARGTYVYPPRASLRLVTDLFAYAAQELPNFNTISISGYHIREAGATAAQELAFTIANGIAYLEAARDGGLDLEEVGKRVSFFWNSHSHFFEEVAKFRAARRIWAGVMRDRFQTRDPASWAMRFHVQTAGSTLTAQQPENNIVRTTVEAMAAVLGGTQSLHTNAFDEALGLPTEQSARLALRTQQILAHESGLTDTVDPLAGSYFLEELTDALEAKALDLMEEVERRGGAVAAIEAGWVQGQIEEAAYLTARQFETGEAVVVGVNRFVEDSPTSFPVLEVDASLEAEQQERLAAWRAGRDQTAVDEAVAGLLEAAAGSNNLLYPMRQALSAGATLGEISAVLGGVFGRYQPSR